MRLVLIALMLGANGGLAADDEALQFVRQISIHYLSLNSHRAVADLLIEEKRPSYESRRSAKLEVHWTPERQRLDFHTTTGVQSFPGPGIPQQWVLPVSAGSHLLSYDRLLRPQRFHQGETQHEPLIRIVAVRLAGEETLTVGARRVACRVVEIEYALPQERLSMRLWVDPVRYTVWKEVAVRQAVTRSVTFREIHFDTPIAAEIFTRKLPAPQAPLNGLQQKLSEWTADAPPADATAEEAAALVTKAGRMYNGMQRFRAQGVQITELSFGAGDDFTRMTRNILIQVIRPGNWTIRRGTTPGREDEVDIPHRSPQPDPSMIAMVHDDIAENLIGARIRSADELEFAGSRMPVKVVEAWYSVLPATFYRRGLFLPTPRGKVHRMLYWIRPDTGLVLRWQRLQEMVQYSAISINEDVK